MPRYLLLVLKTFRALTAVLMYLTSLYICDMRLCRNRCLLHEFNKFWSVLPNRGPHVAAFLMGCYNTNLNRKLTLILMLRLMVSCCSVGTPAVEHSQVLFTF